MATMPHRPAGRPLAPWVFPKRNPGKTLPLISVIMLAVLLVAGIVAIMDSIPLSVRTVYGYARFFTAVATRGNPYLVPEVERTLQECPVPVERVVKVRTALFNISSITGDFLSVLHGLNQEDALYNARRMGLGRLRGRLPEPGKPEAVITRPVATNLGLDLGDVMLRPDDRRNYAPLEVRVVGIHDSDEWFAYTSYEYVAQNHFPPVDSLLAYAKDPQRQREIDEWCEKKFKGTRAIVLSYPNLEKEADEALATLFQILNIVIGLLVLVITIMMGMMISIYLSQRIAEFGLLQAIGFTRSKLIRRAVLESVIMVAAGWVLGIGLAIVVLSAIKAQVLDPKAYLLDPFDRAAYLYTIPAPAAILLTATITIWIRFKRFDPISVIERRIL